MVVFFNKYYKTYADLAIDLDCDIKAFLPLLQESGKLMPSLVESRKEYHLRRGEQVYLDPREWDLGISTIPGLREMEIYQKRTSDETTYITLRFSTSNNLEKFSLIIEERTGSYLAKQSLGLSEIPKRYLLQFKIFLTFLPLIRKDRAIRSKS